VRDPVVDTFLCVWFFLFGTCIGSFLNVALYRLPLKKSLTYPPSSCPHCGHFIRWYDNVPVIGWLKLGGKCRDCRAPISIRYPVIEAFAGFLFASVSVAGVLWLPETGVAVLAGLIFLAGGTLSVFFAAALVCISKKNML
jgi:leader peptidase (prepilin peptidase)/N-methyltransferase